MAGSASVANINGSLVEGTPVEINADIVRGGTFVVQKNHKGKHGMSIVPNLQARLFDHAFTRKAARYLAMSSDDTVNRTEIHTSITCRFESVVSERVYETGCVHEVGECIVTERSLSVCVRMR